MSFGIPVRNGLGIGLTSSTSISSGVRGTRPAMFLNFLNTTSLSGMVTFSRGSNATLVDSTGKITYAPANLLLNSVFGGAVSGTPGTGPTSWTVFLSGGSLTATSLGRSYAANELRFAVTSNRYSMGQSVTIAAGSTYIFSANINVFTSTNLLQMFSFASLPAGATLQYVYGGVNRLDTFIPPIGTGVLQVIITTTSTGGSLGLRVGAGTSSNTTADVSFQDIQFEPVTYQTTAGTYNATTTAAYYGPRFDYDPVTLAPKGLLIEEQRTNLLTYSAQFDNAAWNKGTGGSISANTVTSPDGTSNADAYTWATSTSAFAFLSQTVSATSNIANTFSVWLKRPTGSGNRTIRLSVSDVTTSTGNSATFTVTENWQRFEFTRTSATSTGSVGIGFNVGSSGTSIAAGDILHVWGAQLEAGSFATSYIPTVASTVTRSADVATMTGTNFSSWYNQTEGTFVLAATPRYPSALVVRQPLVVSDGTASNYARIYTYSTFFGGQITAAGVTQADMSVAGSFTENVTTNFAMALQANNFAASANGSAVVTDTSGTLPTFNKMDLGSFTAGQAFNGHIRQIAYYNTRLPDATLQTLTEIPGAYSVDYLSVAGGGGGGSTPAFVTGPGGGGAGGLLTGTSTIFAGTVYTVAVGAGGNGGSSGTPASGSDGATSSFGAISTTGGGGGGGGAANTAGRAGGSGGGGTNTGGAGGGRVVGQGNTGGTAVSANITGAGGGGASAVGSNSSGVNGGAGGAGLASSITGASVTYAGGGGGSGDTGGAGGAGGGGAGVAFGGNGTAGTANLGGGGGGAGWTGVFNGGNGGSGVVILSVPTAKYTGTTTGSPTVTTSGANTILTFTSSGSYTA